MPPNLPELWLGLWKLKLWLAFCIAIVGWFTVTLVTGTGMFKFWVLLI